MKSLDGKISFVFVQAPSLETFFHLSNLSNIFEGPADQTNPGCHFEASLTGLGIHAAIHPLVGVLRNNIWLG